MIENSKIGTIQKRLISDKEQLLAKLNASRKTKKITKVMARTSKRYADCLEMEAEINEVIKHLSESLAKQREYADSIGLTSRIDGGQTRTKTLRNKPSRRYYHLQEIFSLSHDHREIEETDISVDEENILIRSIVIQPEFINDDLLITMGLEKEAFLSLPYHKKLEKKILHIPAIKRFFSATHPLYLAGGVNSHTGRIMQVTDRKDPNYGKIIIIQTQDGGSDDAGSKKTIIFHDDIYSFLRSQSHTLDSLKLKEECLIRVISGLRGARYISNRKAFRNAIGNHITTLDPFKSYRIRKANEILRGIIGDSLDDHEGLERAISLLDKKLKEIISQKASIHKHMQNIGHISNELEENWKDFYKSFKLVLKKVDNDKSEELIIAFNQMPKGFRQSFDEDRSGLKNEVLAALESLNHINLDIEAKKQAYLWSQEDAASGKDTGPKEYQLHQYFEAEKQKKEYFGSLGKTKLQELELIENSEKMYFQLSKRGIIAKIDSLLLIYLKTRPQFCANPFPKIYDDIGGEYMKFKRYEENKDPIGILRVLLAVNILIKQQGFLVFLSKMEGWINPGKSSKSEESGRRFTYLTNRNIQNLAKKDFLRNITYKEDSMINRNFREHLGILHKIAEHLKSGEYVELEELLSKTRKSFYNRKI